MLTSHVADDDLMTESEPDNSPPLRSDGRSQGASGQRASGLTPVAPAPMVGMEPRPALTQLRLPDTSPSHRRTPGPDTDNPHGLHHPMSQAGAHPASQSVSGMCAKEEFQ